MIEFWHWFHALGPGATLLLGLIMGTVGVILAEVAFKGDRKPYASLFLGGFVTAVVVRYLMLWYW